MALASSRKAGNHVQLEWADNHKWSVCRRSRMVRGKSHHAYKWAYGLHWGGLTLIEVLVALALVSTFIALLLPAVQHARESARRAACAHNLKQLSLAVHHYTDVWRGLPPSSIVDLRSDGASSSTAWGIHGRILPFLEQANLAAHIDLTEGWGNQRIIHRVRIELFACPSDPRGRDIRDPGRGRPFLYPTTYGFNLGTYFVYDPQRNVGGAGISFPNASLTWADIRDGLTSTLLAAEVRAWQPYRRHAGPLFTTPPDSPAQAARIIQTAVEFKHTGHTVWPHGRTHHTGVTVTLPPNTYVSCYQQGQQYDCDYTSWQEGVDGRLGLPTYAIVTSRSYHPGGVNVARADGSVGFVNQQIDLHTWRAFGTRAGGEPVVMP